MNLYIISLIIGFIILGAAKYFLLQIKISNDIDEIIEYSSKFNEFVANIYSNDKFDNKGYSWLVSKSDKIQNKLGIFGLISYEYFGNPYENMAVLLNYIGDISSVKNNMFKDNQILVFQAQACENAFLRYHSKLMEQLEDHKRMLLNPFACLSMGIRIIISLPFNILNSIGLISNDSVEKISNGFIMKIIGGLLSLFTILSGTITIVVGWETFIEIIKKQF